ncbi:hypothetical protein V6N12_070788 [Hibiscus sabdariffa]|uniref:Uncharacterized protein n=1 Tax=Hibiscus sabdariffa TaxID=183260 RepID=A0ABR2FI64_9ROSI
MMKEMGYNRSWGEVATSPLSAPKRCSSCPRLETIPEEGSENKADSVPSKKVFLLPVVLSAMAAMVLRPCRTSSTLFMPL